MRISDWSSDVCSSDLAWRADPRQPEARVFRATSVLGHVQLAAAAEPCHPLQIGRVAPDLVAVVAPERRRQPPAAADPLVGIADQDRKSGVEGTRVSVRLDLGGRLIIKKKKKKNT